MTSTSTPGSDVGSDSDEPGEHVPTEVRLQIHRLMVRMREFEERAHKMFLRNLVKGTSHLGIGQEAVAAGTAVAMRDDDYTFCTYRGHNHVLARGTPMTEMMAELTGRGAGLNGGKGGSMHLTSVEHGAMGSYAIVGAHLPVAVGAAWSAQRRGSGQVAVCFFGDGATNIGAFHEALNLAVVWQAPVVFVCENNQYMEYTAIDRVTAVARPAADRAGAYGLDRVVVDGNDADEVHRVVGGAIDRARDGGGPSLIEADTYRHGGHSRADPGDYRPDDEVEEWLGRDPIPRSRQRLLDAGVDADELDRIDDEATAEVDEAETFASEAAVPDVATADTQVFSDGGSQWRN